jgi:Predicted pPIWI-associating nuclease
MSESFDFDKLANAYTELKRNGMALQKNGIQLVKIADSGLANIPPTKVLVTMCNGLSTEHPEIAPVVGAFFDSARHTFVLVDSANDGLSSAMPGLIANELTVSSAASGSNIASGTLVEQIIELVPERRDVVIAAWPAQGFTRSFTEEDLDVYLTKFDRDLPRRRHGAWETYYSVSDDAVAQAAHSMRDILARIISSQASNDKIGTCSWYKARQEQELDTKPNIKDRIRFLLYGSSEQGLDRAELEGVWTAVSQCVNDDATLKQVAHGSGRFSREEAKLSMDKIEELLFLILKRLYKHG